MGTTSSTQTSTRPTRRRQVKLSADETKEEKKAKRNKPDDFIVGILLTMYQGNFLFSQGHDEFFMYGSKSPGLWSPLNELEAKADIYNKLDLIKEEHLPRGFGPRLINDMYAMLKMQLSFDDWNQNKNLLLFKNGVLDAGSLALMPFQREFYMIQLLPYDYNPSSEQ